MASELLKTSVTLEEMKKKGHEKKVEADKTIKLKKLLEKNPYVLDKNGVGKYVSKQDPDYSSKKIIDIEYFIDTPVKIIATSDNLDTDQILFKLSITHPVRGKIEVLEEQSDLTTRNGIKTVCSDGLIVDESSIKDVLNYFRTEIYRASAEEPRITIVSKTGWKRDNTIFVSGNMAFENGKSYEIINTDDENKETFKIKGTLENWIAGTNEILKFKMTRINCYASVASQINGILKQPSLVLLNCGDSSRGKTLSSSVAVSLNGDPNTIVRSADLSKTAAERIAAKTNGFCNVFDETDTNKYLSEFLYLLANGRGRERGNTKGGIDETARWNKSFILNGENPINKESDNQGQIGRLIECNWLLPHNPELAKKVEGTIRNNYGHLTEPVTQKVFDKKDTLQDRYEEICKKLPLVSVDAGNRIKDSFALLILAGEILESVFSDIGIETQDPYKLCEELYLENVGGERTDPYWKRGLNIVLDKIVTSKCEMNEDKNPTNRYLIYGVPSMVFSDDYKYMDLLIDPLKDICKRNELNYDQLVSKWKTKGITVCEKGKNTRKSRVYKAVIRISIDRMNEALGTEFDPTSFMSNCEDEIETEEFEEPDISPEERQDNLMETMTGEAQKEIEYIVMNGRQVLKPRPYINNGEAKEVFDSWNN